MKTQGKPIKMLTNHAMIVNKNQWYIMGGIVGVIVTNEDVKFAVCCPITSLLIYLFALYKSSCIIDDCILPWI